jgi:hypothetical protein
MKTSVTHRKHTYGPPRPVMGIALLYVDYVRTSQETQLWVAILYVDDIRTSQETNLRASTDSYRYSFSFLYVHYIRTSEETHLWVLLRISFAF